jgi:hypothetical protein
MNEALRAYLDEQAKEFDEDVRQAIELADGDVQQALRVAIIANTFLQEENDRLKKQVSKGYARKP